MLRMPPSCNVWSAKPVRSCRRPASSMNGSIPPSPTTLPKFGWLKTFVMIVWKTTFNLSFILKSLESEKLPVFVLASRKLLRATLPKEN